MTERNILIADDDHGVLEVIDTILAREGYKVFLAQDGNEAVEIALCNPVDVAVLDLQMPVKDGLQALMEIKANDPTVEVFVMTGHADTERMRQILDHGAFDYILKPFDRKEITHNIRNAIEKRDFVVHKAALNVEFSHRITRIEQDFEARTRQFRESQIKYKQIVENCGDVILVVQHGVLKFANSKAVGLTGYTWDEIAGTPLSKLIHSEDREALKKMQLEWLEHKDNETTLVVRLLTKSGGSFWGEVNAVRTTWEGGPANLYFVRDVTESRKAQKEVQSSVEKLRKALEGTIQAMALTVESRDAYTAGHQRRVAGLAAAIAAELGLPDHRIDSIRMAGLIHDIGKISLPIDILSKPGRLTDTEFDLIKDHPQAGYEILKGIDFPWPLAQIVLQHHERHDGSGYPAGLSGKDILLEARVLSVADVVEAMGSHRPYRPALGLGAALDEIVQKKNILYDPRIVDACLRLFTEKGYKLDQTTPNAAKAFYLVVNGKDRENEFFPLTERITIGRGDMNDIQLNDEKVSRSHAVIYPIGDQIFVEDLGSRNGTIANGQRIDKISLCPGDTVTIGDVVIRFYQEHKNRELQSCIFDTQSAESWN
jgi:PAS domain S-box-containing protein/putative nucleotidyltransferase with HDIG domain